MFKAICALSLALLLSACATTTQMQMRYYDVSGATYGTSLAPVELSQPRLLDPHSYMDDDVTPRWMLMSTTRSNR